MSKRSSLSTMRLASNAKTGGAAAPAAEKKITTTIALSPEIYERLRKVAVARAAAGSRMSVSNVIEDLAREYLDDLERHEP